MEAPSYAWPHLELSLFTWPRDDKIEVIDLAKKIMASPRKQKGKNLFLKNNNNRWNKIRFSIFSPKNKNQIQKNNQLEIRLRPVTFIKHNRSSIGFGGFVSHDITRSKNPGKLKSIGLSRQISPSYSNGNRNGRQQAKWSLRTCRQAMSCYFGCKGPEKRYDFPWCRWCLPCTFRLSNLSIWGSLHVSSGVIKHSRVGKKQKNNDFPSNKHSFKLPEGNAKHNQPQLQALPMCLSSGTYFCRASSRSWVIPLPHSAVWMINEYLIGGFNPSEKYESQLGWWHSQYDGKNKIHVPNHQPGIAHLESQGGCTAQVEMSVSQTIGGSLSTGIIIQRHETPKNMPCRKITLYKPDFLARPHQKKPGLIVYRSYPLSTLGEHFSDLSGGKSTQLKRQHNVTRWQSYVLKGSNYPLDLLGFDILYQPAGSSVELFPASPDGNSTHPTVSWVTDLPWITLEIQILLIKSWFCWLDLLQFWNQFGWNCWLKFTIQCWKISIFHGETLILFGQIPICHA
jgi:hypothetical protein